MKKITVILGTRPEAIKLAPVITELKKEKSFSVKVISTGQHREMLNQVLDIFNIKVDVNLNLMKQKQDLFEITSNGLVHLKSALIKIKPDLIIVQGDTTTAFVAALSAYYLNIKIAHVEAGLRSFDIYSPYPEEVNRKFISVISNFNLAPTNLAKNNLLNENTNSKSIYVTGNTVIDALFQIKKRLNKLQIDNELKKYLSFNINRNSTNKFVLVTLHRREKFGKKLVDIIKTLKKVSIENKDINFIYPVHLNPNVKNPVEQYLKNLPNFFLLPPLDYLTFCYLMSKCYFIITDSGGIQEESFVFKKPVLVLRNVTERMEAIQAGYAFLSGENPKNILKDFNYVNKKLNQGFNFFPGKNPFGDGKSAEKIVNILKKKL